MTRQPSGVQENESVEDDQIPDGKTMILTFSSNSGKGLKTEICFSGERFL